MSSMSLADAQAILDERNVIKVGSLGDDERRRRHGAKTTFVRVFEVHAGAVPSALPASASAGEIRVVGKPASPDQAAAALRAARTLAGSTPVTAYSLIDLLDLAGGTIPGLCDLLARLAGEGLDTLAEAPIDLLPDPIAAVSAARDAGVQVPRLTVHHGVQHDPLRFVAAAREIQTALGGVRAFAPLARVSSIAQPSTGYDDVKQIALARLVADNIDSIQVDWALYGPKLAQVALTMGADDVDAVSPLEGDLGRRRSPIEEIRGNIKAAGLEPVERDGSWSRR